MLYCAADRLADNAYGQSSDGKYSGSIGLNPPFGATVFFHIPAELHGKTPVSLEVLDDQGTAVRRYALHLKKKQPKLTPAAAGQPPAIEEKQQADEKLTAITPGINSLHWDLRYADATEVMGFEPPEADGRLDDYAGPTVNPGH